MQDYLTRNYAGRWQVTGDGQWTVYYYGTSTFSLVSLTERQRTVEIADLIGTRAQED